LIGTIRYIEWLLLTELGIDVMDIVDVERVKDIRKRERDSGEPSSVLPLLHLGDENIN